MNPCKEDKVALRAMLEAQRAAAQERVKAMAERIATRAFVFFIRSPVGAKRVNNSEDDQLRVQFVAATDELARIKQQLADLG